MLIATPGSVLDDPFDDSFDDPGDASVTAGADRVGPRATTAGRRNLQ